MPKYNIIRLEVFTAVAMKTLVFWDVMPFGSYMKKRFGGTYPRLHQGDTNRPARKNVSSH
jgi:hypothetical protein